MSNEDYTIRSMRRDEFDLVIGWAASEGWNPGLNDGQCYHLADPEGFLVGIAGEQLVASISVVRYGELFGFLGFYIVKPEYRGQGYGIRLWNKGLEYLNGRVVGLDGVVDQQENYMASGFRLAYRNIRYQGCGDDISRISSSVVDLSMVPLHSVIAYDQPFFPDDRARFIENWIIQPDSSALGYLENNQLRGYGVIRRCISGHKIGPLFADSPEIADALFTALKSRAKPEENVYLDTPEVNSAAVDLAERSGMEVSFETARMYLGQKPKLPIDRIFGVTSFELG